MPKVRKKPCKICRDWFQPDARVGARQRACTKPECQTARRQETQADWRKRNPDYGIAWRLDQRAAQSPPPQPLRVPGPLNQLPWEFAKVVGLLPEAIQQHVRDGKLAAPVAMKYLVPVARANIDDCARMAAAFVAHRCDTRQAG